MKHLTLAVAASFVLASSPARATPNFPAVVQQHLGLAQAPDCSLCHNGPQSIETVTTPFGKAIRERGVTPYDETALKAALDSMAAEKVDSNGDGIDDIDELKEGKDPNAGANGAGMATPEYGCSAGAGASNAPWGWLFGVGVAGAVLVRRRRRRS